MIIQRQVSNSILCSSIYIVLSARRRRRARQHNSRSVEMQRLAPPRRAPADTQRKRANAFDEQRAEQARRSPTRAGRRWRRRRRRARAPVARRSTDANNARRHGACRPARLTDAPIKRASVDEPRANRARRSPTRASQRRRPRRRVRPSVGSTGCNDVAAAAPPAAGRAHRRAHASAPTQRRVNAPNKRVANAHQYRRRRRRRTRRAEGDDFPHAPQPARPHARQSATNAAKKQRDTAQPWALDSRTNRRH